jgi:hypothetical protein
VGFWRAIDRKGTARFMGRGRVESGPGIVKTPPLKMNSP